MKTINASDAKINFGKFIKTAQEEEVVIIKNGKPILRVTPIRASRADLVDELFDWGVKGVKDEFVMEEMVNKYYGK